MTTAPAGDLVRAKIPDEHHASAPMTRPLLVGEDNPYGTDPRFALFPLPKNSAGWRLCHVVLGMTPREYLGSFDRANLCSEKWSWPEARSNARILSAKYDAIVLLGKKVAKAFSFEKIPEPFYLIDVDRPYYVFLPHPSGRCRTWNEPGAIDRARGVMRAAGIRP